MADTDDQIIEQIKKIQKRIQDIEAKLDNPETSKAFQDQIAELKSEIEELKKAKQKKVNFGEW